MFQEPRTWRYTPHGQTVIFFVEKKYRVGIIIILEIEEKI